jgi:hypothetical protein
VAVVEAAGQPFPLPHPGVILHLRQCLEGQGIQLKAPDLFAELFFCLMLMLAPSPFCDRNQVIPVAGPVAKSAAAAGSSRMAHQAPLNTVEGGGVGDDGPSAEQDGVADGAVGSGDAAAGADVEFREVLLQTQPAFAQRTFMHSLAASVGFTYGDVSGVTATNEIRTTKYTVITFLPKNLFEQFTRVANLYFLLTAVSDFCGILGGFIPNQTMNAAMGRKSVSSQAVGEKACGAWAQCPDIVLSAWRLELEQLGWDWCKQCMVHPSSYLPSHFRPVECGSQLLLYLAIQDCRFYETRFPLQQLKHKGACQLCRACNSFQACRQHLGSPPYSLLFVY